MKRAINISVICGAAALLATSCMGIDNFDEPSSRLHGTVTDSDSQKLILQDQGHTTIRIKEVSFLNAEWQNIPVKQDGTYNNNKLFAGHYDMVPVGAWWPCDTVKAVPLGGEASKNFEVTPYLRVMDVKWSLEGTNLSVSCRLKAPLESMEFTTSTGEVKSYSMPKVEEVRVFVSMNQFCGSGNHIGNPYDQAKYAIARDTAWSAFAKEDTNTTIVLSTPEKTPLPLKSGYTYFMRVGASTKNHHNETKYNYSEIAIINVP